MEAKYSPDRTKDFCNLGSGRPTKLENLEISEKIVHVSMATIKHDGNLDTALLNRSITPPSCEVSRNRRSRSIYIAGEFIIYFSIRSWNPSHPSKKKPRLGYRVRWVSSNFPVVLNTASVKDVASPKRWPMNMIIDLFLSEYWAIDSSVAFPLIFS